MTLREAVSNFKMIVDGSILWDKFVLMVWLRQPHYHKMPVLSVCVASLLTSWHLSTSTYLAVCLAHLDVPGTIHSAYSKHSSFAFLPWTYVVRLLKFSLSWWQMRADTQFAESETTSSQTLLAPSALFSNQLPQKTGPPLLHRLLLWLTLFSVVSVEEHREQGRT